MKYDVILVLGRGIEENGELFGSGKACTEKAVQLFQEKYSENVLFSGKWSYQFDYIPIKTEAEAMAEYAISLGLPKKAVFLEKESVSTVTNLIFSKEILIQRGWKKILVIYFDPYRERTLYLLKKVLGNEFNFELIKADFPFDSEKYERLSSAEIEKLKLTKDFFAEFRDGDDEGMCRKAKEFHRASGLEI